MASNLKILDIEEPRQQRFLSFASLRSLRFNNAFSVAAPPRWAFAFLNPLA